MTTTQLIYCCGCGKDTEARLTDGEEIYPHRRDLYTLPFWKCDVCGNHVGTHHKTRDRTRPLGCIPTPAIKKARMEIHSLLDPIWKYGNVMRQSVYRSISRRLGYEYHTAEIRSLDEAYNVIDMLKYYHEHNRTFPPLAGRK